MYLLSVLGSQGIVLKCTTTILFREARGTADCKHLKASYGIRKIPSYEFLWTTIWSLLLSFSKRGWRYHPILLLVEITCNKIDGKKAILQKKLSSCEQALGEEEGQRNPPPSPESWLAGFAGFTGFPVNYHEWKNSKTYSWRMTPFQSKWFLIINNLIFLLGVFHCWHLRLFLR